MPHADSSELRRNMALLLRWLHPDRTQNGGHSVFVQRVTRAWNDLKSDERRATYDRGRRLRSAESTPQNKKSKRSTSVSSRYRRGNRTNLQPMRTYQPSVLHPGFMRRVFSFLFDRLDR
jgi:curved DNA-binding protein CbpA